MNKIEITQNGIQLSIVKNISFCNKQQRGNDFDHRPCQEYVKNIIKAYAGILIDTLKRRMDACILHLELHIDDIEYADNDGHIVWKRKDGSYGQFSVQSYEAMEQAIEALKGGYFGEFLGKSTWIDQTLKALLNDPVDTHKDLKEYKYSELVSILCEAHLAIYKP